MARVISRSWAHLMHSPKRLRRHVYWPNLETWCYSHREARVLACSAMSSTAAKNSVQLSTNCDNMKQFNKDKQHLLHNFVMMRYICQEKCIMIDSSNWTSS